LPPPPEIFALKISAVVGWGQEYGLVPVFKRFPTSWVGYVQKYGLVIVFKLFF